MSFTNEVPSSNGMDSIQSSADQMHVKPPGSLEDNVTIKNEDNPVSQQQNCTNPVISTTPEICSTIKEEPGESIDLKTENKHEHDYDELNSQKVAIDENLELEKDDDDIDVLRDPDWTEDSKIKLIYSEAPFSDDHLFFLQHKLYSVGKHKAKILEVKAELYNCKVPFKRKELTQKLEAMEKAFIEKYVYKVKFDENLPLLKPLDQEIRDNIYNINKTTNPLRYKVDKSDAQLKAQNKLKLFRKHVNILKHDGNKYASKMENFLFHKETKYKELFNMKLKTTEELKHGEENKLVKISINHPPPPWIHELTDDHKQHLMFSSDHNSKDHKFWYYSNNKIAKHARNKLKILKNKLEQALSSGDQYRICIAKEALTKKKELFVNTYIKKIDFDETLPEIEPLATAFRRSIHGFKNALDIFKTRHGPERKKMLLEIRLRRKHCNKLDIIGNKFAKKMWNHLYHMEHEYKNKFLTFIEPDTEQKIADLEEKKETNRQKFVENKNNKIKKKLSKGEKKRQRLQKKQALIEKIKMDTEPLASWELKTSLKGGKKQNSKQQPKRRDPNCAIVGDKVLPPRTSGNIKNSKNEWFGNFDKYHWTSRNISHDSTQENSKFAHRFNNQQGISLPNNVSFDHFNSSNHTYNRSAINESKGMRPPLHMEFEIPTLPEYSKNESYSKNFENCNSSWTINEPRRASPQRHTESIRPTSYAYTNKDTYHRNYDSTNNSSQFSVSHEDRQEFPCSQKKIPKSSYDNFYTDFDHNNSNTTQRTNYKDTQFNRSRSDYRHAPYDRPNDPNRRKPSPHRERRNDQPWVDRGGYSNRTNNHSFEYSRENSRQYSHY